MKKLALILVAALLTIGSTMQAAVVAHWSFDESSGTVVGDSARPGSPGTVTNPLGGNANLNVVGQFGSGLNLSNGTDYVSVPRINMNNTSFTVAGWVNPTSLASGDEIFGDWSNPWQVRLFLNSNGSVSVNARKAAVVANLFAPTTAAGKVSVGNWSHVALTWDQTAQAAIIYVDGVQEAIQTGIAPPHALKDGNHANYQIGWKRDDANHYDGLMDELYVFDNALNVLDVNKLMNTNDPTPAAQPPLTTPVVLPRSLPFNTLVTHSDGTSFTSAPFILTDPVSGESATIQIGIESLSGDQFLKLDGNTRLGVGNGAPDGYHVDVGPLPEDVQFTATLLGKSAGVGDVGFNITALGLRDTGDPSIRWTSDVTAGLLLNSFTGEADRAMDLATLFHALTASDYTGLLEVTANQFQMTENGPRSGISFSVQLNPTAGDIPEPATMALLGLAVAGLSGYVRRRRKA